MYGAPAPEVTPSEDAEEKAKAEEPKELTLQEKVKQAIGLICKLLYRPLCSRGLEADLITEQTSTRRREFLACRPHEKC